MAISDTYPLDPSGALASNKITAEVHNLQDIGYRVLATRIGAFYVETLVVKDMANNQVLTPAQFYAAWRYKVPTAKYGKDVCGLVVITDSTVSDNVSVTYQAVGGLYAVPEDAVIAMLNRNITQNRSVGAGLLVPKPLPLQPHDFTTDLFNFARLTDALDGVARVLSGGCVSAQDSVMKYMQTKVALYQGASPEMIAIINTHANDPGNPHPNYLKVVDITAATIKTYPPIMTPKVTLPLDKAVGVIRAPVFQLSKYAAMYGIPQKGLVVQLSLTKDFAGTPITYVAYGTGITLGGPEVLRTKTLYYCRAAYQSVDPETQYSAWSPIISFTTA